MARRTFLFLLQLTFFGLTSNHRKQIFDQVHEIVFYGQGGYSFTEVYELPIHLRKYIHHTLVKHYEGKNKTQNTPEELTSKIKDGSIQLPEHMKGKKVSYNGR